MGKSKKIASAEISNSPLVIPNFEEFGNYLYDRIYLQLRYQELVEHSNSTIFLILRDKSIEDPKDRDKYIYVGLDHQKRTLQKLRKEHCPFWDMLGNADIKLHNLPVTSSIISQFEKDELSTEEIIKIRSVSESYVLEEAGGWPNTRKGEYGILEHYFEDPQAMYFIGLPVFQFGELEGVVQIVFSTEDKYDDELIEKHPEIRTNAMRQIIRICTQQYEDLLWNWQLPADIKSIKKREAFNDQIEHLFLNAASKIEANNKKIFKELHYKKYYKRSIDYFELRADQKRQSIQNALTENRRRAVMAILVDSFAHNVSAHSLTVIKWIFQQRLQNLEKSQKNDQLVSAELLEQFNSGIDPEKSLHESSQKAIKDSLEKFLHQCKQLVEKITNAPNTILPIRDQPGSIDREMVHLFRFLSEKGAFWSGMGRDQQFGGEIRNLYDVLFTEFAENPLYLGTIAHSEGISKIHLKVKIYKKRESSNWRKNKKDPLKRSYVVDQNDAGLPLEGILSTIDLGTTKELIHSYPFFQKGNAHDLLESPLKKIEVFFPGGVVGRHAFYSMLENALRDIKHYGPEELDQMQREGLTLAVSVFPSKLTVKLRKKGGNIHNLYKIGIWIEAKQDLWKEGTFQGINSLENIQKGILTKQQHARLGGSQQDKICASMLMTGCFTDVDTHDGEKNTLCEHYFPWIRFAQYYPDYQSNEQEKKYEFEYEFRHNKNGASWQESDLQEIPKNRGYLKKYFHVWKGDFIHNLVEGNSLLNLNLGRYQIVNVQSDELFHFARKNGAIRVIRSNEHLEDRAIAYHRWLKSWLGNEKKRVILKVGRTEAGFLLIEKECCQYFSKEQYKTKFNGWEHANYHEHEVRFEHSKDSASESDVRLRIHGILKTKWFPDVNRLEDLEKASIKNPLRIYELAETILTNVCVFDERIAQRITHDGQRRHLHEQLCLNIQEETLQAWKEVQASDFLKYNLLVFHISFIKKISNKNGKLYTEGKLAEFLEEEILKGRPAPENFIFVVTSGRGRFQWKQQLEKEENDPWHFVTFRPSESLINAVEDGNQLNDDFQIKYNLLKVLLGS